MSYMKSMLIRSFLVSLIPVVLVGCGTDDDAPIVAMPIPVSGFEAMSAEIRAGQLGRIEAVVVDQSGSVVYETYFRDSNAGSRIDVRSVGKSLTALAIGAAVEDGLLESVDVPVWDYLIGEEPVEHDGPAKREITVDDLLSMSSTLDCSDWVSRSPGNEERMYRTDVWRDFALNLPVDPDYRELPNGYGRFSYCTAGVFLLGQVVEKATGQRFDSYVQARLFDPLGIAGADWRRSPSGEIQSGGQLGVRPADLARVGRMVLNGGTFDGQRILSADWLRTMLTPKVGATADMDYGYLWWTRFFAAPNGTRTGGAFMSGNGGNIVVLLPDYDAVAVVAATSYNRDDAFDNAITVIETHVIPELAKRTGSAS
ncbi:serine hydrolase domain-containing protein [Aurantiacibacter aquimixticola]|nr:serine hydrolase [Aurantiacibacter aquimixticola]